MSKVERAPLTSATLQALAGVARLRVRRGNSYFLAFLKVK